MHSSRVNQKHDEDAAHPGPGFAVEIDARVALAAETQIGPEF